MATSKGIPAVAYYRRSDKGQTASIVEQRSAVTQYASEHSYRLVREYVDDGISGDLTEKRVSFQQMIDDASGGNFKAVLCWDQDRFGRFDLIEAGRWISPLREAGVCLVTVGDGVIDWQTFAGRMLYSIKQEGKHEFLRDLSQNVTRGQMEAAQSGSWSGSAPYGYKIVGERKQKRLEFGDDPTHQDVVRRIFAEYTRDEHSMSEIARRLNNDKIPSPSGSIWRQCSVSVILENAAYVGTFVFNKYSYSRYNHYSNGKVQKGGRKGKNPESDWIVHKNNHPAIVDQKTFDQAQAILAKGKTGRSPYTSESNPFLLTGKLRCGRCGGAMNGETCGKYRYYKCRARKMDGDEACIGTTVREDKVLSLLAKQIEKQYLPKDRDERGTIFLRAENNYLDEADLPPEFKKLRREIFGDSRRVDAKRVKKDIEKLDKRLATLNRNMGLIENPKRLPALEQQMQEVETQRERLVDQLQSVADEAEISKTIGWIIETLGQLQVLPRMVDAYSARELLRVIDQITCHTEARNSGNGRRHNLKKVDVHFAKQVRAVNSNLNRHQAG